MEETLWNLVLETDDCLLSIESLKEESLCDTDMQSLLGAWDRKCRQGTFSAKVSLLINNNLSAQALFSFWLVRWLHSPVFGVNDGIDKRVVDGWGLGYNCRDCFGIGIEDASISEKCNTVKLYITCDNTGTVIPTDCIAFHHALSNDVQEVECGLQLMAEMNNQASFIFYV